MERTQTGCTQDTQKGHSPDQVAPATHKRDIIIKVTIRACDPRFDALRAALLKVQTRGRGSGASRLLSELALVGWMIQGEQK